MPNRKGQRVLLDGDGYGRLAIVGGARAKMDPSNSPAIHVEWNLERAAEVTVTTDDDGIHIAIDPPQQIQWGKEVIDRTV